MVAPNRLEVARSLDARSLLTHIYYDDFFIKVVWHFTHIHMLESTMQPWDGRSIWYWDPQESPNLDTWRTTCSIWVRFRPQWNNTPHIFVRIILWLIYMLWSSTATWWRSKTRLRTTRTTDPDITRTTSTLSYTASSQSRLRWWPWWWPWWWIWWWLWWWPWWSWRTSSIQPYTAYFQSM